MTHWPAPQCRRRRPLCSRLQLRWTVGRVGGVLSAAGTVEMLTRKRTIYTRKVGERHHGGSRHHPQRSHGMRQQRGAVGRRCVLIACPSLFLGGRAGKDKRGRRKEGAQKRNNGLRGVVSPPATAMTQSNTTGMRCGRTAWLGKAAGTQARWELGSPSAAIAKQLGEGEREEGGVLHIAGQNVQICSKRALCAECT